MKAYLISEAMLYSASGFCTQPEQLTLTFSYWISV